MVALAAPASAHASDDAPGATGPVSTVNEADVEVAADSTVCKRQHYSKVAYTFWIGPMKMPLRCGTKSWGYNHIVERGRWSTSFKNKISDTLYKGYERSPGVYYRYKVSETCTPKPIKNFKVVVNKGPLGGKPGGLTPQGVITAVEEYTSGAAAGSLDAAGTKC
ncbi:hypothetical protein [Streptomyces sp. JNUCC 63]